MDTHDLVQIDCQVRTDCQGDYYKDINFKYLLLCLFEVFMKGCRDGNTSSE